jgi:hypothetical protein
MPELQLYPYPKLDDAACREKLYTLLAIFLASKQIAEQCDWRDGDTFRAMLDEHEIGLATHLLIECAVLVRMKDDIFLRQHGLSAETTMDIVGRLLTGDGLSDSNELNLREACNKIVHAKGMNFDVFKGDGWHARYLLPVVHLRGERAGLSWKAELNVVRWIECGFTMFP